MTLYKEKLLSIYLFIYFNRGYHELKVQLHSWNS